MAAPLIVKAHVLESDSDIGAILHVYPDDNLISGRPVNYILSFQDVRKHFSLFECDCTVTYKLDGVTVATQPLETSSKLDSRNSVTFDEPGEYIIEVSGQPNRGSNFQPFKLVYEKRVATGEIKAQGMPLLLVAGFVGLVLLLLAAAYVSDSKQ